MYIQSFKRYETKYLISRETADSFIEKTSSMLIPDEYGSYSISNLYLDTEDYHFIRRSLEKPVYKEKLRIRRYGTDGVPKQVFFEIKKKYNGIVSKRRVALSPDTAEAYLSGNDISPLLEGFSDRQIFSEIDFIMKKYSPVPKLYLAYDRCAFTVKDYPDVRITFDKCIRSRQNEFTLYSDNNCRLLDTGIADYKIMEIKCGGAVPIEIAHILSKLKIYPTSFSKYGRIYCSDIMPKYCPGKEFTNV